MDGIQIEASNHMYWSNNFSESTGTSSAPTMVLSKSNNDSFSITLIKGGSKCYIASLQLAKYLKWALTADGATITASSILSSTPYMDVADPDRTSLTFVYNDLGDDRFELQPLYQDQLYFKQIYFADKQEAVMARPQLTGPSRAACIFKKHS